jgi:HEPN domain-containing protein
MGAVHYFQQREWRISSVLSAIAVESVLAEMYEELMQAPVPPKTLGELLHELISPARIPEGIIRHAETVNSNRIISVHRSTSQAGENEALSSLVDSTRFTYWAYHQGPLTESS